MFRFQPPHGFKALMTIQFYGGGAVDINLRVIKSDL